MHLKYINVIPNGKRCPKMPPKSDENEKCIDRNLNKPNEENILLNQENSSLFEKQTECNRFNAVDAFYIQL